MRVLAILVARRFAVNNIHTWRRPIYSGWNFVSLKYWISVRKFGRFWVVEPSKPVVVQHPSPYYPQDTPGNILTISKNPRIFWWNWHSDL